MDIAGWMDQTDGTLLSLHKSFNMRALCPASSIVEKKREKGRRTGPRLKNVGCVVACLPMQPAELHHHTSSETCFSFPSDGQTDEEGRTDVQEKKREVPF